ncbi:hypothetical protein AALP_AA8G426200 [Arabis alpina]|uniref:ER membrane protein complex subunit 4 n=1 Tax=Arabis alpina TaxID=50452 RepID=A0A087GD14_ARAAL|nr:hypothetical protein AALP_AA8G426200 [Arabis alpina]
MWVDRRWAINFFDRSPSSDATPFPPGFSRTSSDKIFLALWQLDSKRKYRNDANSKLKKAWQVAQSPFKNLMMMCFLMWMVGNTLNLFSIGITFSALWQSITALWSVAKIFEPFEDNEVELFEPKLVFIALNLGRLAMGIYKLNSLGLLPTHASDWVSSLSPPQEVEYSSGGIVFY